MRSTRAVSKQLERAKRCTRKLSTFRFISERRWGGISLTDAGLEYLPTVKTRASYLFPHSLETTTSRSERGEKLKRPIRKASCSRRTHALLAAAQRAGPIGTPGDVTVPERGWRSIRALRPRRRLGSEPNGRIRRGSAPIPGASPRGGSPERTAPSRRPVVIRSADKKRSEQKRVSRQ